MNLVDVARRAKVSRITVSRVVNHAPDVKDTTRAHVLKVVEELKYRPNLHARRLAAGKSRTIGVIVANIENPFFHDIYRAVERRARAAGYEVIMANTDYRSEQLVASVRLMIGQRVGGLAAIVSEMDSKLIDELDGYGIPVVFCDVGPQRQNITNIRVDYRRGMDRLTDYLYCLGHRRIGVVGHRAMLRPVHDRVNVGLESLARYADVEVQTATDMDSPDGGSRATRALLSAHPELTALMFVNDFMALGAPREIRDRGLRVPEDLSVTGFDDVALAQYWSPALTSVHIPRDQIGRRVCDALVSGENKRLVHEMVIDPELVLRESTGPAAKS
jgi:DNA-binding LacI/PurR family transcriptional regulator